MKQLQYNCTACDTMLQYSNNCLQTTFIKTLLRTTGSVYQCCEYHQKVDSHQQLHLVRCSPQPGALHFNGVKGSEFLSDALAVLHWHAGSSLVPIVSCPDYFSHAEGKNSVVNRLSNFLPCGLKRISLCTDLLMRKKLRVYPKFRF